jgi:hypothetical protein
MWYDMLMVLTNGNAMHSTFGPLTAIGYGALYWLYLVIFTSYFYLHCRALLKALSPTSALPAVAAAAAAAAAAVIGVTTKTLPMDLPTKTNALNKLPTIPLKVFLSQRQQSDEQSQQGNDQKQTAIPQQQSSLLRSSSLVITTPTPVVMTLPPSPRPVVISKRVNSTSGSPRGRQSFHRPSSADADLPTLPTQQNWVSVHVSKIEDRIGDIGGGDTPTPTPLDDQNTIDNTTTIDNSTKNIAQNNHNLTKQTSTNNVTTVTTTMIVPIGTTTMSMTTTMISKISIPSIETNNPISNGDLASSLGVRSLFVTADTPTNNTITSRNTNNSNNNNHLLSSVVTPITSPVIPIITPLSSEPREVALATMTSPSSPRHQARITISPRHTVTLTSTRSTNVNINDNTNVVVTNGNAATVAVATARSIGSPRASGTNNVPLSPRRINVAAGPTTTTATYPQFTRGLSTPLSPKSSATVAPAPITATLTTTSPNVINSSDVLTKVTRLAIANTAICCLLITLLLIYFVYSLFKMYALPYLILTALLRTCAQV